MRVSSAPKLTPYGTQSNPHAAALRDVSRIHRSSPSRYRWSTGTRGARCRSDTSHSSGPRPSGGKQSTCSPRALRHTERRWAKQTHAARVAEGVVLVDAELHAVAGDAQAEHAATVEGAQRQARVLRVVGRVVEQHVERRPAHRGERRRGPQSLSAGLRVLLLELLPVEERLPRSVPGRRLARLNVHHLRLVEQKDHVHRTCGPLRVCCNPWTHRRRRG